MKKVIINENQKGFLFRNGKYTKLLGAGKYVLRGDNEIETVMAEAPIRSEKCSLAVLLADPDVQASSSVIEVGDEEIALHFEDGKLTGALRNGKHAFWNDAKTHTFRLVDVSSPEVTDDIPSYVFVKLPQTLFHKVEVAEYQKARLFFDRRFVRILEPGVYYFWRNNTLVDADFIDTRLTQMNVQGQEILTRDKVALRINFVCSYRITDYVKILTEIDNYEEQIHVAVQLALRDYVGSCTFDEILEKKEELSGYVRDRLKAREKDFFVEIIDAGVKDIILPGEIRDIMNTVLIAEKKAQANVITRREEVASTRSLLNTAKLMDENKTLYKLKELEYIERICENVGNIDVGNGADILTGLRTVLGRTDG